MPTRPTPQTLTLRLKHNRTTIFLHVDRTQPLDKIKSDLLHALKESCPDGTLNGHQIPSSASQIHFAKPTDPAKLEAGWESLEPDEEDEMFAEEGKGKGKGKPAGATPTTVGLKDGWAVAFRFVGEDGEGAEEWDVELPTYEDQYEGLEPDEVAFGGE